MRVKLYRTSTYGDDAQIKEYDNLLEPISYALNQCQDHCVVVKDVQAEWKEDSESHHGKYAYSKPDYDYEVEIYDDYRE
jgi:hypothetical protein